MRHGGGATREDTGEDGGCGEDDGALSRLSGAVADDVWQTMVNANS